MPASKQTLIVFCVILNCYIFCVYSMVTKSNLYCPYHGSVFANPSNCSTFIQCDNGTAWIIACQRGLYFNPRSGMCDKPRNVECNRFPVLPPLQVHRIPSPFECYTCVYFQSHANLSMPGCDRSPPLPGYRRKDCFAFGNIGVAASIRQSTMDHHGHINESRSATAYCVTYTARSEIDGSRIILRGCEQPAKNHQIRQQGRECFTNSENNFHYPPLGNVQDVEKCYCSGNGCNAGEASSGRGLSEPFLANWFRAWGITILYFIGLCKLSKLNYRSYV